jgi:tetratricopeptide (TPR) repeat protein
VIEIDFVNEAQPMPFNRRNTRPSIQGRAPKAKSQMASRRRSIYVVRDALGSTISIIGLAAAFASLAGLFHVDIGWVGQLGYFAVYLTILHAFVGGLVYSSIMFLWRESQILPASDDKSEQVGPKEASESASEGKLSGELEKIVRQYYDSKDYIDTIRVGAKLSRALWLSGRYKERVAIGEMIEDASSMEKMPEEQIIALIDDTGWTNVVLRNLEKAEKNIRNGIKLALENGLFYCAAKGERHLAQINARYRNNADDALRHLEEALRYGENISDGYQREEMRASILYARADLLYIRADYLKALKSALSAQQIYGQIGGQEERLVKTRSQLGRIYTGLGDIQRAKDSFRIGLTEAEALKRPDEIAFNNLGLGEVYLQEREYDKAIEALHEASELFDSLGMVDEARTAKRYSANAELERQSLKTIPM